MIKKVLIIVTTVFLVNTIISSCCTETFVINGIDFTGAKLVSDHGEDLHRYYRETDTLTEKIVFRIQYSMDYTSGLMIFQNDCYATSCATEYTNELVDSTFVLTSDKSIIVEGDSVSQGENWWTNIKVKKYIHYFENANDDWHIEFIDDFKMNSVIANGNYRFFFECKTDDNKSFKDSVNVVINLK